MLTALLIGFVLLPLLVSGSIVVFAEPPAGVIAYACHDHKALVLLAYDKGPNRNGWAAFGGHGEKGERIVDTAAREFREETRCLFNGPDPDDLLNQKRSAVGPFYSYVSQVEYIGAAAIEKSRCGTPNERNQFIWVEAPVLKQALTRNKPLTAFDNPDKEYPFWFAGRLSLQQALEDGLLPTDNKVCQ
ncbi:NUDIX hydrolase [Oceanobacter mangrovi]|uniref:NUDIX hydrolase n=1 Tax=Oceanobacter mangrovi TaxID=2862510 RepID=UPI001C8D9D22|nr:NUDIX domain-containing protein [Oceanobacter mangrovi]